MEHILSHSCLKGDNLGGDGFSDNNGVRFLLFYCFQQAVIGEKSLNLFL